MIFRAVARAGSISAVARDLGWTQPAVSQQLAALGRGGRPVGDGPRGTGLADTPTRRSSADCGLPLSARDGRAGRGCRAQDQSPRCRRQAGGRRTFGGCRARRVW
ncbi:LysR family transcriptional regulator [Kribbella sp. NPDC051137]|uniref:helix-turn-helix domain-containing protein n=1 Tax=Kribbella sp. NPDC051137 TaxID=3155045 RepID=UPI0034448605